MKVIIVALTLMAIAAAAPAEYEPPKILRSNFEKNNEGGYVYSFETEDGTQRDEKGDIKEVLDEENKPHSVIVVRGFFSFLNNEGKPETINYYADETGYHAEGESIPKSPSRK